MINRPTVLEINERKFLSNIDKIQEYVGSKELMPVIKANGYGTYINITPYFFAMALKYGI